MNREINIDVLAVFIFLGIFHGFVLSFFFILKKSQNTEANRFQGFLLLALTLCINEQFLNMTGMITRVLALTNTSEPLNLIIGPLLYMYVKRTIDKGERKREWLHFLPVILYALYMSQDYIQSDNFKYNSYVNSFHPDWPILEDDQKISDDPLGIKKYLNTITAGQIIFYIYLSFSILKKKARVTGERLFKTDDDVLRSLRNMITHILAITTIFIIVKLNFRGDLGDYFIGMYVSVFIFLTTFRIMNDSAYFERSATFMDISIGKYQKSSLTEARKQEILNNIINQFEKKQYFSGNLASLSDLSKQIGESQHHVSQVINEKTGKNFFEMLASYRIEKAKIILQQDKSGKLTIEELSEMVGYNSKTAFNNSFKKLTGKTPSEYRKLST